MLSLVFRLGSETVPKIKEQTVVSWNGKDAFYIALCVRVTMMPKDIQLARRIRGERVEKGSFFLGEIPNEII